MPYLRVEHISELISHWDQGKSVAQTYHSLLGEGADLLDGLRSTLLEADAVAL